MYKITVASNHFNTTFTVSWLPKHHDNTEHCMRLQSTTESSFNVFISLLQNSVIAMTIKKCCLPAGSDVHQCL